MSDNDDDYDTISRLLPSGCQAMHVCVLDYLHSWQFYWCLVLFSTNHRNCVHPHVSMSFWRFSIIRYQCYLSAILSAIRQMVWHRLTRSQTYTKGLLLLSSLGLPSPVRSAEFSDGLFFPERPPLKNSLPDFVTENFFHFLCGPSKSVYPTPRWLVDVVKAFPYGRLLA